MSTHKLRRWSRRCFVLMWIPFTTLMIGMMDMPKGDYSFSELPALARFSVIPLVALFAGTFVLMIASVVGGSLQKKNLLKNGQVAKAKILKIYETGTTVNNSYLMGFGLEVHPANSPVFEATTEQLVSRLDVHKYEKGMEISVKCDPKTKAVAFINKH